MGSVRMPGAESRAVRGWEERRQGGGQEGPGHLPEVEPEGQKARGRGQEGVCDSLGAMSGGRGCLPPPSECSRWRARWAREKCSKPMTEKPRALAWANMGPDPKPQSAP